MVTTGNRSRIRFKDPREIRAIVCPTPPPPLHPISPFLSLLNFETSWGVSIYIYIYTYTRIHCPSAYIITTRATFLRDQTIENLLPFVHRPSRRRKRKKRRRRKEIVETRLFYKRIKVFRTFKNRVAPGKDVTRIVRDFVF